MADQYDRVLIRLSSADDDKLGPILSKLLPLVFDALLKPTDAASRTKIIGVLNHALTRAKGNKEIKLPVQGIVELWFDPLLATSANAPFFRNLSVIFVDLGLPRLDPLEQVQLALLALRRFGDLTSKADHATLFLSSIPGLAQIAAEGRRKEEVPRCLEAIAARPATDAGLAAFFNAATEFLLIPCGSTEAPSVSGMPSANWAFWKARLKAKPASDMIALKLSLLKWLASLGSAAPSSLVYLPSLVASVDNYDAVCSSATSNCARLDPELDLAEDEVLLGKFACAALTSAPPGQEDAAGAFRVEPKANVPSKLRVKIMALLQRAPGIGAPAIAPFIVHVIRQSFRESEQVQIGALHLALALAERVSAIVDADASEHLAAISEAVMKDVEAVFWPGGGVVGMGSATPLAFRVYGSFAKKLSELPGGEGRALALEGAPRMLTLLASNEGVAQDILEALSGLVACLRGPSEDGYLEFVPLLDRLVCSPRPVVRREVLRWATTLFPASAPEGRYYALRLFGDQDRDVARSAETALSAGRHEAPPFEDMCGFLAMRALGSMPASGTAAKTLSSSETQASWLALLTSHSTEMVASQPSLPPLASHFSQSDICRALAFLLELAEAEGMHLSAEGLDAGGPPMAKRPRLNERSEGVITSKGGRSVTANFAPPLESFIALLDYILLETVSGRSAVAVDVVADGNTALELALRGLLLAAALMEGSETEVRSQVVSRIELVLFAGGSLGGALFREGGHAVSRARRLGAVVLGAIGEKLPMSGNGSEIVGTWLEKLGTAMDAPPGSSRRAGAVLGVCELLRFDTTTASPEQAQALCQKAVSLLAPDVENDMAVLASICDGLRRLSERKRFVWDVVEAGGCGNVASLQVLLDRLYDMSKLVTSSLGDTKEAELGVGSRDLVHASWRLLGQLAAWNSDGAADCVDRLVAIGRQSSGEEAATALGLALAAVCFDPSSTAGPPGKLAMSSQAEALMRRLLKMIDDSFGEGDSGGGGGTAADGVTTPAAKVPASAEEARATLAEREATQRCGVVWLAVLLRRLANGSLLPAWLADIRDGLCRAFVRATGGLSIFTADCALKALCFLYQLTPADARTEFLKTTFSSISNRTVVSNMFVGHADTQARRDAEKAKEKEGGPNSLKITAKERVDSLKDLMFFARDLGHNPLFMALLDQPVGSIWTGEIFREALDLQSPCLSTEMQEHLCPQKLRTKLYPFFFHQNGPLRQAVVKMSASYFSCETPQQLATKFPKEWAAIAANLVEALGNTRVSTRLAAIQAAQALFRGRLWADVCDVLEELWLIVVRLMDDMETEVQLAVKPLMRMIRNLSLRLCDLKISRRKDADAAMDKLIPLLLKCCERYKHAQPLCFDVMRELVKAAHGTTLLTKHVQNLIPPLLVSLSMMEHDSLQYWQFHVDSANADKGKELEAARVSNSRDSESMRLLRLLVPLVSQENAEELAPRSRDLLHRGVGANTRVGVCDFWVAVCAERASAVPAGGVVAKSMLRSVAGALLDSSSQVRSAAASCFASFARRNEAHVLTEVVFERLMKQDQEYRIDDTQRSSFRAALARALWEVCRRCDDGILEPELKAAIASKAFGLRYSDDHEVKTGWESLWSELCPTTSGGVERYHKEICAVLADSFEDSISRAEKMNMAKAVSALAGQLEKRLPRPAWGEDEAVVGLQKGMLKSVQTLPIFDGNGLLLRALADATALMYRRKRGDPQPKGVDPPTEDSIGLPLILGFCAKGNLQDRGSAAKAAMEVMSAARLWGTLSEAASLYEASASRVDAMQKELEEEKREPGESVPMRYRGKATSPAEEYLTATLDLWTGTLEQCRREEEDEGDLEPPDERELSAFARATLQEFYSCSLTFRLAVVRMWKRVFGHLKEERVSLVGRIDADVMARIVKAIQDASLDPRSERLRRPALELAGALVADDASGGGRDAFKNGLSAAIALAGGQLSGGGGGDAELSTASTSALPAAEWLAQLDSTTAEQCADAVSALRQAL
eukprot:TRINITY_DN67226_c0_g1_i1.p1 TRINITY_DN67226_c0_g1~~TRINITY_DN67226_c0_g1_i1.p1  ORF type:complete len:2004 (-),score=394.10 TRINITY_DN67226_c0_g1_i1:98-6109(-)